MDIVTIKGVMTIETRSRLRRIAEEAGLEFQLVQYGGGGIRLDQVIAHEGACSHLEKHDLVFLGDLGTVTAERFLTLLVSSCDRSWRAESFKAVFTAMVENQVVFADADPKDFLANDLHELNLPTPIYNALTNTGITARVLAAYLSDEFFVKHVPLVAQKSVAVLRLCQAKTR